MSELKSFINCMTKIWYPTKDKAQAVADRIWKRKQQRQYPYMCRECLRYHLTSQRPPEPPPKPKTVLIERSEVIVVKDDVEFDYIEYSGSKRQTRKLLSNGWEILPTENLARKKKTV